MNHAIDTNDLAYAQRKNTIVGWVPDVRGENGKINPHLTRMVNDKGQYVGVFHVKPIYYENLTGYWRPLSEVTSHYGNKSIVFTFEGIRSVAPRYISWLTKRMALIGGQVSVQNPFTGEVIRLSPYLEYIHDTMYAPKLGFTVTTVYPDPNAESTSVDGAVANSAIAVYSTCHDATSGTSADDSSTFMYINHYLFTGNYYISRTFALFDTSAISDTDSIDSGICSFKRFADQSDGDGWNINLVASTPASNTALVTDDYDQLGTTLLSATTFNNTSWSGTSYLDFTLNSSGLTAVSKTGVSKYGLRMDDDISSTTPTQTGYCAAITADNTGTASDPKLEITHSAGGSTFTPRVSFIM